MDEFALIAAIRARLTRRAPPGVTLGIGDDAAVLAPMAGGAVLSVDVAVEGVHFDRRWLRTEDVGWRSYTAALSDSAAMGASPKAGLLSLILPADVPDDDVLAIVEGVAEAAEACGAPVVGGNVSSGAQLSITSTVVGEAGANVLTRSGARPGHAVYVTGTVGTAALGLALLATGRSELEGATPFVDRWRRPRARFDAADALRRVARSAVDVSDGLVADLVHICEASGVGATIEVARLPLAPKHETLAAAIGRDGADLALAGGEDYELLFTAPPGTVSPDMATAVGSIEEGDRVRVLEPSGAERSLATSGHRHR